MVNYDVIVIGAGNSGLTEKKYMLNALSLIVCQIQFMAN